MATKRRKNAQDGKDEADSPGNLTRKTQTDFTATNRGSAPMAGACREFAPDNLRCIRSIGAPLHPPMKTDRFFYSAAGAIMLLLTFTGFFAFFSAGKGFGGGEITPAIRGLVITHGVAITLWYVLFLVQSLLVASRNTRIHMKLGWSAIVLGLVIVGSGIPVAVKSVALNRGFVFFGMNYTDFLLVMLVELAAFAAFLSVGLLRRKRPEVHRPMMLLAGLSLLIGATTRIPFLVDLFGGGDARTAFFGPVYTLMVLLVVVRLATTRKLDRPLAIGSAAMMAAFLIAEVLSRTDAWRQATLALIGS
jgi:hypothetical protein